MRAALGWIAGLALIVLAGAVTAVAPDDDATQVPFVVEARLGERAAGRDIAATITDVRLADEVTAGGWRATGAWVVVDLEAEALLTERAAQLAVAQLRLGDRTFAASERPESLADARLEVGLPRAGSLAFEVPAGAATGEAVLRLGRVADDRLDSVLELRIDLDAAEHVAAAELRETTWAP